MHHRQNSLMHLTNIGQRRMSVFLNLLRVKKYLWYNVWNSTHIKHLDKYVGYFISVNKCFIIM